MVESQSWLKQNIFSKIPSDRAAQNFRVLQALQLIGVI
jgi:hypothetical protein